MCGACKAGELETGVPRIEVTPEMIEAARDVLYSVGRWEYRALEPDRLLVREMLHAALSVAPQPRERKHSV